MKVGVGRLQTDVASPAGRAQARGVQRLWILVCVGLLTAGAAGCERAVRGSPRSLSGRGMTDADDLPTEAQPTLRRLKVWVGPQEVQAEVCLSAQEIRTGMMFRTNILDSEAMLFVFAHPHQAAFWMKNVPIPLACAYIDPEGTILEIHELQPHNTNSVVAGTDPASPATGRLSSIGGGRRKKVTPATAASSTSTTSAMAALRRSHFHGDPTGPRSPSALSGCAGSRRRCRERR